RAHQHRTARPPRATIGWEQTPASPLHWQTGLDTPAPTHVPADRLRSHWRRRTPAKLLATNPTAAGPRIDKGPSGPAQRPQ
ncbi:hypothetical protein P7K49_033010, partial [Saguinus oedipus]